MHGYFLSLKLYDAARIIANPYVYEEQRAKMVQEKLDKLAEGRIRTRKDQVKVKVNKALAEKIALEEEREKKREERKRKQTAVEDGPAAMDVDEDEEPVSKHKTSLLSDSRFAALFEDPDFQVDEKTREFALLNPSAAAQKRNRAPEGSGWGRGKTAVEEEDEESDKMSSGDQGESSSPSDEDESEEDSSEAGGTRTRFFFTWRPISTTCFSDLVLPRTATSSRRSTNASMRLIPLQAQPPSTASDHAVSRDASFGHRRSASTRQGTESRPDEEEHIFRKSDGSVGVSWVPAPRSKSDVRAEDDGRGGKPRKVAPPKGVERFGAGMEKGGGDRSARDLSEQERSGRTQRRRGMRSGSKNALRQA
jgi:ribosome biogenesis protein ENP2